ISDGPAIAESEGLHDTPEQAQEVSLPVVVNGKIGRAGEVDYYAFETLEGQEITFEVIASLGFDPRLTLYEVSGSWFDPRRAVPLASNDDPTPPMNRRLIYRYKRKGRYLVKVGHSSVTSFPPYPYQLQVALTAESTPSQKKIAESILPQEEQKKPGEKR